MGLATAALARRAAPRGALVATALVGVIVSLGPYAIVQGLPQIPLPYRLLSAVVPGFSAMRAPQRFGVVVTCAVVGLAGLGLAALRSQLAAHGWTWSARALAPIVVATALIEAVPRDLRALPMQVGPTMPAAQRWLAAHATEGPVLNLPARRENLFRESLYLYWSTAHWLPLINGYTGYP